MDQIKHLLNKQLARKGLGNLAQAALVCQIANNLYRNEFQAISFRNSTLEIMVKDSYQAMVVQAKSQEIIKIINQKISPNKIEQIKFKVN